MDSQAQQALQELRNEIVDLKAKLEKLDTKAMNKCRVKEFFLLNGIVATLRCAEVASLVQAVPEVAEEAAEKVPMNFLPLELNDISLSSDQRSRLEESPVQMKLAKFLQIPVFAKIQGMIAGSPHRVAADWWHLPNLYLDVLADDHANPDVLDASKDALRIMTSSDAFLSLMDDFAILFHRQHFDNFRRVTEPKIEDDEDDGYLSN